MFLQFSRKGQPSLARLADRARNAGEWGSAAALYGNALARDLRDAPLWVQYGHALKESGALQDPAKLARAETAYRRALIYAPRVADTHLQLGHVLKLQGRTDEAKAAYVRALALDPTSVAAGAELRALGWEEGDGSGLKEALALLNGVAAPRRGQPSWIEQADAARDAAQWVLAARCYRAVLERQPDNAEIWVQYGHALKEAGNLKDPARLAEAEAAYRRALALAPGIADNHLQLGHVLKLQEKIEEAELAYLRAFVLGPVLSEMLLELRSLGWSKVQLTELETFYKSDSALAPKRSLETTQPTSNAIVEIDGVHGSHVNTAQETTIKLLPEFFDSEWYAETYLSGDCSNIDPLEHFLREGSARGYNPNSVFDTKWYQLQNPDIRTLDSIPFIHFIEWGAAEGRRCHPKFDYRFYCAQADIVGRSPLDAIHHYISIGRKAGLLRSTYDVQEDVVGNALGVGEILPSGIRLAIGIVIYHESERQISRIVRSAQQAIRHCNGDLQARIIIFDNGGIFDPAAVPTGVSFLPSGRDEGFAIGHNRLMEAGFGWGATVYIGANPDGAFHPNSIRNLLRMNIANQQRALIEALQFPGEHPRYYDPQTLETPWASGACFLMPKQIWEQTAGFDPKIYIYCEDIDLSWRVRRLGFRTLTCPAALFYHDVTDRGYQAWRWREMLLSGRYLAWKWNDPEFRVWTEERLLEEGFVTDLEQLPSLEHLPAIRDADHRSEFRHYFHFAPVRW